MFLSLLDIFCNRIYLTKDCWHNHILVRHPIMRHFLKELETTMQNPDYVYRSKTEHQTRLYYQLTDTKFGKIYILVVIDMKPNRKIGYVKTALPVYKIKGGKLLWRKI